MDLGAGRNVVAVLAHGDSAEWVDTANSFWVEAYGRYRYDEEVWSGRGTLRGVVELKPPLVPTLVTFADTLDSATVQVVWPDGFEEALGPGFRFRRPTLEVVPRSVPVTIGVIEPRLPWLAGMTTNLAGTRGRSTNDLREWLNPPPLQTTGPVTTMDENVFRAILAMDAYKRGWAAASGILAPPPRLA